MVNLEKLNALRKELNEARDEHIRLRNAATARARTAIAMKKELELKMAKELQPYNSASEEAGLAEERAYDRFNLARSAMIKFLEEDDK